MRIEALERISSDGYVLEKDDVLTVPDEIGASWCRNGWGRDTSGAVETGERRVLDARLLVDNVAVGHKASNLEG